MTQHFRRGNHYAAHLTPEQVVEIRRKYAEGYTQGELVKEYDVGLSTIARCVRGETWRHIAMPRPELTEEELTSAAQASEERMRILIANDPVLSAQLQTPALSAAPVPANAPESPPDDATQRAIDDIRKRYGLNVTPPK